MLLVITMYPCRFSCKQAKGNEQLVQFQFKFHPNPFVKKTKFTKQKVVQVKKQHLKHILGSWLLETSNNINQYIVGNKMSSEIPINFNKSEFNIKRLLFVVYVRCTDLHFEQSL